MFTYTKSKLGDFMQCPRKFYFKYLTILGKQQIEEPQYLIDGKYCHALFEEYNKGGVIDYSEKNDFVVENLINFANILEKFGFERAIYTELKLLHDGEELSGYIDAVYKKDEQYYLIDYKTGKFREYKMADMRFELYLYVFLIESFFKFKIDFIGMFYTQFPDSSFIEKVSRKKIDTIMGKYRERKAKINCSQFERNRDILCNYCEFVFVCGTYTDDVIHD
jgi:ATP-dependent helicase/nuclease subunit B